MILQITHEQQRTDLYFYFGHQIYIVTNHACILNTKIHTNYYILYLLGGDKSGPSDGIYT